MDKSVLAHLGEDYKRINRLMENGIQTEETSGKQYYTGYEYKTLYDWDQYFEAIVQLYMGWDTHYIKNGVTIFLDYQRDDGFIARTVPVRPVELEGTEHVKPFLSQIILLLYKKEASMGWLTSEYYEKLKKYLVFWTDNKDINKNSLSTWDSAPHTGMDNQHERAGWWKDNISEGVDLNSFLYRECKAFSIIAQVLGRRADATYFEEKANSISEAVQNYLWDEEDGFYYDRNEKTGEIMKIKSSAGFAPLWAGIATPNQAERLVRDHLLNCNEFWRPFPVPSYAANQNGYSEDYLPEDLGCNWRANTWIPTNYYIFHGLRMYGYHEEANQIADITYKMVKEIGDREYYTSESCKGCGLDPFWGWSLLAYFMPMEYEMNLDPTQII